MNWIILLSIIFCESYAQQLTSPDEAVCVDEQLVFVCQQPGATSRWRVNLPGVQLSQTVSSSLAAGTVLNFVNDPGFGFEIHILNSSSASSIISELCVTAVRQLNGVTVECAGGSGSLMSTVQIASVDPPAAPSGVITTTDQSQFTPSTASITLTWSASSTSGADNYTIMVTPFLPLGQSLVSTTTTSLQLTVLYNEEYSINITAQNCVGSNSTIIQVSIAGCSPPSPPGNGSISTYSSGAVGAVLTFQCDTGYMPQEEVTSTCLSNRNWIPIPGCEVLFFSTTTEGDPDNPIPGSGSTLSTGSQVIITASVCSLGFLLLGMLLGALLHYCIIRRTGKFKMTSSSPTPPAASAPVIYEEVLPADSHTDRKNDIELNENVAYGPVPNTSVQ